MEYIFSLLSPLTKEQPTANAKNCDKKQLRERATVTLARLNEKLETDTAKEMYRAISPRTK